jgi:hypothetical protein
MYPIGASQTETPPEKARQSGLKRQHARRGHRRKRLAGPAKGIGVPQSTPRPEATGLHRARKQAQQFSGWIVSPQPGFFLRNQGKHGEGHGHQLRANAPTGQPSGRRKPTRRA